MKIKKSFVVALYLSFFSFQAVQAAEPTRASPANSCAQLLQSRADIKEAVDRRLSNILSSKSGIQKWSLQLRAKQLQKQIYDACVIKKGCTPAEIGILVREHIARMPRLPNSLGYGFLVGGLVANAAMTSGILTLVNQDTHFFPAFVSSLLAQTSFVTVSLFAPFWDPIVNNIRKMTFAWIRSPAGLAEGGYDFSRDEKLESQADVTHSTYTLREQFVTDRIFIFRNTVMSNFQVIRHASESNDQDLIVAEIADALFAGYRYFVDIDPAEPAIVNAVQASLLRGLKDAEMIRAKVMEIISKDARWEMARKNSKGTTPEGYAARALSVWIPRNQ